MTENDIKVIESVVKGTFHKEEGELLIFSSHTFPSHRITVIKEEADKYLTNRAKDMIINAGRN
jgi:hypothetical protein